MSLSPTCGVLDMEAVLILARVQAMALQFGRHFLGVVVIQRLSWPTLPCNPESTLRSAEDCSV